MRAVDSPHYEKQHRLADTTITLLRNYYDIGWCVNDGVPMTNFEETMEDEAYQKRKTFDNIIKSIISGDGKDEIRYAVAYNGDSRPAIRKVIYDLSRQLEQLIQQGIE
jgi:hypothetical protein